MPKRRLGDLDCQIEQEEGALRGAVILCHGFGAPGDDLVPLAAELRHRGRAIAEGVRFYFPAAPIDMTQFGLPGGRAWWPIDIDQLTRAAETGDEEDLAAAMPQGLGTAPALLRASIEAILDETGLSADRLVIGGFSQGAMLAIDVTLNWPEPVGGLVVASGALAPRRDWPERAAQVPSLHVIQGHGRQDPLLPFTGAQILREMFIVAGHQVEFVPFDGGHGIAPSLLDCLAQHLCRLPGEPESEGQERG